MENLIIITGNPCDGFQYIGPFPSVEDAETYVREIDNYEYWIANLHNPGDDN